MSDGINWNAMMQMAQNRLQMVQPASPQPQLPSLGVIFVEGRPGVDAYPLPPNCNGVPLFDRESGALFIKSTDAYGNPSVTEFEPPVQKKTEADIQKALFVKMDERMTRIEELVGELVNGGAQNGRKESNSGGFRKGKSSDGSTEQHGE